MVRPRSLAGARRLSPCLGAMVGACLAAASGCATDNPHEFFRSKAVAPLAGRAGSGGGGTSARAGSGGAPSNGGTGNEPHAGNTSSSGGRGAGSGGRSSAGTGPSESGSTNGGSSAHAGSASGGSGGSGAEIEPGGGGEAGDGPDTGGGDTCGAPPVSSEIFTKAALRAQAADCAVWHYCKFEAKAAALDATSHAYAADPTEATLARAQAAWREAMSLWSRVELFQFGPLASRSTSAGKDTVQGQGIREFVYSWPLPTRCRVEEQVASQKYATQGFENVLVSSRGLFGIEYLLFYPGSDTACAPGTAAANTWATLDDTEIASRKLAYLTALSGDVLGQVRRLLELWSPASGNFKETFVSASGYQSEQQALTILAWSLVYAEREVKDWKLGIPAGYTLMAAVNGPEAPFSHVGTDDILQNLRGFRALFQGCGAAGEGLGFDDWLAEAGHGELATDMIAALDAAETMASTFPPLDTASSADLDAFYHTVKALTDLLKSDLFGAGSPLNLELPEGVASDTD